MGELLLVDRFSRDEPNRKCTDFLDAIVLTLQGVGGVWLLSSELSDLPRFVLPSDFEDVSLYKRLADARIASAKTSRAERSFLGDVDRVLEADLLRSRCRTVPILPGLQDRRFKDALDLFSCPISGEPETWSGLLGS